MTKGELRDALKAKGIFDVNSKDQLWKEAFDLYYRETRNRLSFGCGGCYTRLRNWMNA